jgi:hypothetical protein
MCIEVVAIVLAFPKNGAESRGLDAMKGIC